MSTETNTREYPILFNGEMVRAVLSGSKTQTRRLLKPQPTNAACFEWTPTKRVLIQGNANIRHALEWCPYGQAGERLWVRETWQGYPRECPRTISYRADSDDPECKWNPSIHMSRWMSRIDLEITRVRVERIQEISGSDAAAEGFHPYGCGGEGNVNTFHRCWDGLNAKRGLGWDTNPWVWVIEFRVSQ